ncbi:hypothetical protein BM221_003186 [Beauveria bassiana]|uniref:Uncharacterized protein n=1 Tax=Beauveria bassiana TaxID=176275 RepID=A0A2N6NTY4_BEABA|nr:hypothetical protein BM221_003186 [Beauveria bassiana]
MAGAFRRSFARMGLHRGCKRATLVCEMQSTAESWVVDGGRGGEFVFRRGERLSEIQLLVEAAAAAGGLEKKVISEEEAAYTYKNNAATDKQQETLYTEFQPDFQYEVVMSDRKLYGGTDFGKRQIF